MAYCSELLHRLWVVCLAAHEVEPEVRRQVCILRDFTKAIADVFTD